LALLVAAAVPGEACLPPDCTATETADFIKTLTD
jgi:hypothetical protein